MKKKPKKAAARPAAAKGESAAWIGLALALSLGAFLGWRTLQIVRVKVAQHLIMSPQAALAPQGQEPGKTGAPRAIEAGPEGTLYLLQRFDDRKIWFAQRFGADFKVAHFKEFPDGKGPFLSEMVDLAVDAQGTGHVGFRDGKVVSLDPQFKVLSEFKLETPELSALECAPGGNFFVLDALGRRVALFGRDGRWMAETSKKKLLNPKRLTVTGSGDLVVLDEGKAGYSLKVFGADLSFKRAIPVANVSPSPPVRIAGGKSLVAVNDAHGARGVLFYDVDNSRFVGETLGVDNEPMIHPGFVSADPATGDFYLHFGPGLLKCRVPGT